MLCLSFSCWTHLWEYTCPALHFPQPHGLSRPHRKSTFSRTWLPPNYSIPSNRFQRSYSVLRSLVTCFTRRPTLPKDSLALCGRDSFRIDVFVYHPFTQCFDTQDFNKYSVAQKKYGLCNLSLYALLSNTLKMFSLLATRISNEYKDFLFHLLAFLGVPCPCKAMIFSWWIAFLYSFSFSKVLAFSVVDVTLS